MAYVSNVIEKRFVEKDWEKRLAQIELYINNVMLMLSKQTLKYDPGNNPGSQKSILVQYYMLTRLNILFSSNKINNSKF